MSDHLHNTQLALARADENHRARRIILEEVTPGCDMYEAVTRVIDRLQERGNDLGIEINASLDAAHEVGTTPQEN